ncbi:MAG: YjbH domain-containing protein [Candidatus Zhuqueibacterota bacterium]
MLLTTTTAHTGISLAGTSGLINIPTAEVIRDQQVMVGFGIVNRHGAYLQTHRCDNFPFYIVIGYLPRLEFSAGVTFVPGQQSYDGSNTYKDGVVSVQYVLVEERPLFPAIALGARDIYSFILLNTTYIVASKNIVRQSNTRVRFHAGYGSDVIDRHLGVPKSDRGYPVGHTILGVFGGMEINWKDCIVYMLEYDTRFVSTGVRFRLNPFLHFDFHLLNMEHASGSLNLSFRL